MSGHQDFIYILEQHATNCEGQGKYIEAEVARNRLDELKIHEENRKREELRARQLAERLGVEEAHMIEFQQFNNVWDKKMTAYEENAAELIMEMKVTYLSWVLLVLRLHSIISLCCLFLKKLLTGKTCHRIKRFSTENAFSSYSSKTF